MEGGGYESEIIADPDTNEAPTQTCIRISEESTTSPPTRTLLGNLCFEAATLVLVFLGSLILNPILIITSVIKLVLLLGSFVALTLVQFFIHGVHYDKVCQLKFVIRFWIYVVVTWLMVIVGYVGVIVPNVAKEVKLVGMSFSKWLEIMLVLYFLYLLDFTVNMSIHLLPPVPLDHGESGLNVQDTVFEIVDSLVLLLTEFTLIQLVPNSKEYRVFGLAIWKWIMVVTLVVIGQKFLTLLTHFSAWQLQKLVHGMLDPATMTNPDNKAVVEKLVPRDNLVYYVNGLKRCVDLILSSLLVLLTWVLYFGSHLSKTPQTDDILRFGTRTCVTIFVCSILWLFKTWIVLSWEASSMYTQLRSQIIKSGTHLYFIGVLGRHDRDIFKLTYYKQSKRGINLLLSKFNPREWLTSLATQVRHYVKRLISIKREFREFRVFRDAYATRFFFPGVMTGGKFVIEVIVAYLTLILDLSSPGLHDQSPEDKEDGGDDFGRVQDRQYQVKKLSVKEKKHEKRLATTQQDSNYARY